MRPLGIVLCYKENNEATRQCDVILYYLPKSPTNIQHLKKMTQRSLRGLCVSMSLCCDNFPTEEKLKVF